MWRAKLKLCLTLVTLMLMLQSCDYDKDAYAFDNLPVVYLTINGKEYSFILDTGAKDFIVDNSLLVELGYDISKLQYEERYASAWRYPYRQQQCYLQLMINDSIPTTVRACDISEFTSKISMRIFRDFKGIVGYNFMREHGAVMHYGNDRVYWK